MSPVSELPKLSTGNEQVLIGSSIMSRNKTVQRKFIPEKAALLFGTHHAVEEKSSGGSQGPRQRAESLAAINNAFNSSTSIA